MTQFQNAKQYADFISALYGRRTIKDLNKVNGDRRLARVVSDTQRWASAGRGWGVEEGGVESAYGQAAYGLEWVINSGRVIAYVVLAVRNMNVRDLCNLIDELMRLSANIGDYARYLMEKYTPITSA
jgi:hypothetical protein